MRSNDQIKLESLYEFVDTKNVVKTKPKQEESEEKTVSSDQLPDPNKEATQLVGEPVKNIEQEGLTDEQLNKILNLIKSKS